MQFNIPGSFRIFHGSFTEPFQELETTETKAPVTTNRNDFNQTPIKIARFNNTNVIVALIPSSDSDKGELREVLNSIAGNQIKMLGYTNINPESNWTKLALNRLGQRNITCIDPPEVIKNIGGIEYRQRLNSYYSQESFASREVLNDTWNRSNLRPEDLASNGWEYRPPLCQDATDAKNYVDYTNTQREGKHDIANTIFRQLTVKDRIFSPWVSKVIYDLPLHKSFNQNDDPSAAEAIKVTKSIVETPVATSDNNPLDIVIIKVSGKPIYFLTTKENKKALEFDLLEDKELFDAFQKTQSDIIAQMVCSSQTSDPFHLDDEFEKIRPTLKKTLSNTNSQLKAIDKFIHQLTKLTGMHLKKQKEAKELHDHYLELLIKKTECDTYQRSFEDDTDFQYHKTDFFGNIDKKIENYNKAVQKISEIQKKIANYVTLRESLKLLDANESTTEQQASNQGPYIAKETIKNAFETVKYILSNNNDTHKIQSIPAGFWCRIL